MYLSENLKILRHDTNLSQSDVAKKIDIKRTTYQAYEDGRSQPDINTLQYISDIYGIPIDILIKEKIYGVEYDMEKGQVKLRTMTGALEIKNGKINPDLFYAQRHYIAKKIGSSVGDIPVYNNINSDLFRNVDSPSMIQPEFYLPSKPFGACDFGVRVNRWGLDPEVKPGDYIMCKEISLDNIVYGDMYLVITVDGVEYNKYISPVDSDPDSIQFLSNDTKHPASPIKKVSVKKIFKVRGILKPV